MSAKISPGENCTASLLQGVDSTSVLPSSSGSLSAEIPPTTIKNVNDEFTEVFRQTLHREASVLQDIEATAGQDRKVCNAKRQRDGCLLQPGKLE